MEDDGVTVKDAINDFKDPIVLADRGVSYDAYSEWLNALGITEEVFYSIIPKEYVWFSNSTSSDVSSEWTEVPTRGRKPKENKE